MAGRAAESPEEAVRRLVEIYNRQAWEVFEENMHPEFEFHSAIMSSVLGPGSERAVYRGLAGLRRWMTEVEDSFEEVTFECRQVTALGPSAAFESARMIARGRGSGIETTLDFTRLWEFEGGLVRRVRSYRDAEEARRAAVELTDAPGEVPGA